MAVATLVISVFFVMMITGLSIRANARFRHEARLPMQWTLSRTEPLCNTIIWSATRVAALSLIPALAIGVLSLLVFGAAFLTPRPGQQGMLLPAVIFIGSVFVAAHFLHVKLIEKTLRR